MRARKSFDEIIARQEPRRFVEPHPRIVCEDGVSLSVQASHYTYCTPRDDIGPYSAVEVGFPSVKPPRTWKQYAETWSDPTGTVYAWVPVEVVRRFIKQHGGEKA